MSTDVQFTFTSSSSYDILGMHGALTINSLVLASSELNRITNTSQHKDLVLDLSQVNTLDSSGIRIIINLDKKIRSRGKKLYILRPHEAVLSLLTETNMLKVLTVIDSSEMLEKQVSANLYDTYLPYTYDEDGLKRISCACAVCGSHEVIGYHIDPNSITWRWVDDDPFPSAYSKDGDQPIDINALQPIVCSECFMCSISPSDFHILGPEKTTVIKSTLQDESKNLLTKSIKKRKKMMELGHVIGEAFFMFPREAEATYKVFELAEFCARTLSVLKTTSSHFDVGYLNYIAIRYSGQNEKEIHINNCRTWFTQVLQKEEELTMFERAVSYFVLLIADMNLEKKKEAAQRYNDFTAMIKSLPSSVTATGIQSPLFWYNQADFIWKREIAKQSSSLKI